MIYTVVIKVEKHRVVTGNVVTIYYYNIIILINSKNNARLKGHML